MGVAEAGQQQSRDSSVKYGVLSVAWRSKGDPVGRPYVPVAAAVTDYLAPSRVNGAGVYFAVRTPMVHIGLG